MHNGTIMYIEKAFLTIKKCFETGGRLFICGNGGSSSDSEHILGELLKSFKKYRPIEKEVYEKLKGFGEEGTYICEKLEGSLPVYSLNSQTGIMTAFANDKAWDATFAQELYGLVNRAIACSRSLRLGIPKTAYTPFWSQKRKDCQV